MNGNIPKERPIENYADWANWVIGNKEKLESVYRTSERYNEIKIEPCVFKSELAQKCFNDLMKKADEKSIENYNRAFGNGMNPNMFDQAIAASITHQTMTESAWEVASNIEIGMLQAACSPRMSAQEAKNRIESNYKMSCIGNKNEVRKNSMA
jgi:hypothetical protein